MQSLLGLRVFFIDLTGVFALLFGVVLIKFSQLGDATKLNNL